MESSITSSELVLDPAEWIDAYGDYLYRYALSRLRDANAAEEALQETYVAGIRHRDQFRGTGSQRAWLLGILKHKIIDCAAEQDHKHFSCGSMHGLGRFGDLRWPLRYKNSLSSSGTVAILPRQFP